MGLRMGLGVCNVRFFGLTTSIFIYEEQLILLRTRSGSSPLE